MSIDVMFVLPAGSDKVSGGNLYNECLTAALVSAGKARVTTIGACRALIEQGVPGLYFIDTLDLDGFGTFPVHPGQHFGLIVHHLASFEMDNDLAAPAREFERATLARFEVFVATSPLTADFLRERGIDARRIMTVLPAPPASVADLPSPSPPFVLSAVGNLIRRKGQLELLQELSHRVSRDDRFILEFVGRTDIEPEYARACMELGQTSDSLREIVRWIGPVPHEHVARCYRRAAAFVSASKMETFGMALQEARTNGLPILAVDGGYARYHFTSGQNGLLFGSIAALAEGLLGLIRDPSRLHALFARAQASRPSTDYSWEAAAQLFSQQLHDCWLRSAERDQ